MEHPKEATVLVVGGGGRCHAIVDALSRSPQVGKIYCAPGNAGIAAQAECVPFKETQVEQLRDFASERGVDLTVVGPEVALPPGLWTCSLPPGCVSSARPKLRPSSNPARISPSG